MVRPRRIRRIFFQPDVTHFKPVGISMADLKETALSFDELEAIRLIDFEEMEQNKAGKKMKISQSTLSRLLRKGRKKLADAIVNGRSIKIQGGNFKIVKPTKKVFGRGLGGRGKMSGFAEGLGGICKCPKCSYEEPQVRGQPCINKKCPKCQTKMIGG